VGVRLLAGRGVGGGRRARGARARTARGAAAAFLVLLAVGSTVSASAATLGGAAPDGLGAASASNARTPAVTLEWQGAPTASGWTVGGVTVRAEDSTFAAGDVVKLTAAGASGAPCEVRTTTRASARTVAFDAAAFAPCGAVAYDALSAVAVSVSGARAAVTTASSMGPVSTALSSFMGAVRNGDRVLRTGYDTVVDGGVSYLSQLRVAVTTGATGDDLVGERLDVALRAADGGVGPRFGGVVSAAPDAAVRVVVDPSGMGERFPTIVIDPRAGRDRGSWVRTADVTGLAVLLAAPQRLGTSPSAPAVSLASGTIQPPAPPAPRAETAVDAVAVSAGAAYSHPPETNYTNGLSFCHTFTVTNTTSQPVRWTVTFDTSLPPLWGLDPTAAGALSSSWGFQTLAYDRSTHLWTIGGIDQNAVIPAGQSVSGMQYCVEHVPEPPVDPSHYRWSAAVVPDSSDWNVQLRIAITSDRVWNEPWRVTVDLADYVCPASLVGKSITFDRVHATPVPGSTTRFVLTGTTGDTRYVSASHPRDFVFASFAAGDGGWRQPCR